MNHPPGPICIQGPGHGVELWLGLGYLVWANVLAVAGGVGVVLGAALIVWLTLIGVLTS